MKNGAVQIGLVGCGVVGNGVVRILQKNLDLLEAKAGTKLQLAWVASRRKKPLPSIGGIRPQFTKNSESDHGPNTRPVLGLKIAALLSPLSAGFVCDSTSK